MRFGPEWKYMSLAIEHDVAWPVAAYAVGEIRDLVEPVVCRGDESTDHEPAVAAPVESGPGYVVYACPECGLRALYHHSKGDAEPCCSPRG